MHVLIIGGTGLISTSIVQQLLDRGDRVTLFNRGVSAVRFSGEFEHLAGDRWKPGSLESAIHDRTFDAVIDMAAFAPENGRQLLSTFAGRTAQIVLCSTCCVYGGPQTHLPIREDAPRRPFGNYGVNKASIEDILMDASGVNGTHATILRPSYTTGEGAAATGLLFDASLVWRLRNGLPVIVMDDGNCPWAISHVSDVARGFVASLGNTCSFGQAYHLTSHEHSDWNSIHRAIARAAGGPEPDLVQIPSVWLRAVAPRRSLGIWFIYRFPSLYDNARAEVDLGFRTTVSLQDTFTRQIAWMEEQGPVPTSQEDPCQEILLAAWQDGRQWPGADPRWLDWNPWGNASDN